MIMGDEIEEQFEVVGSDGGHVGKVDHVLGDTIELAKIDVSAMLKHHLIPLSWVARVIDQKVFLSMPAKEAKSQWREKPTS